MALHKLIHQLIEHRSFMVFARRQAQPAIQEELPRTIGMQQGVAGELLFRQPQGM